MPHDDILSSTGFIELADALEENWRVNNFPATKGDVALIFAAVVINNEMIDSIREMIANKPGTTPFEAAYARQKVAQARAIDLADKIVTNGLSHKNRRGKE